MENKKLQKTSVVALIISLLPMVTLLPVLLKITLPDGVRSVWAGANVVFVLTGLCVSIACVRKRENRNTVNIASTVISVFWVLVMAGIGVLALFLNYLQ